MPGSSSSPRPLTKLERFGLASLKRSTRPVAPTDPVEVLTPEEQRRLRRIERRAVLAAALAGALSALATLGAGLVAPSSEDDALGYWLVVGGVTAVASLVEIAFLYFDALGAVREMAHAAGLDTSVDDEDVVALALARAALELPTPLENALGVDPTREANRTFLIVASLLYKAKVTVTNFLLKALVRRALGRMATRTVLDAVAIPVTALWNAVVTYWVVREARLRIVGTSAAAELERFVDADEEARPLVLRAIACVLVKSRSVHPNVDALARRFLRGRRLADLPEDLGDASVLGKELDRAAPAARDSALRAAIAAAIVDGRLSRRERALLVELHAAARREVPWSVVHELRHHLVRGDGLRADLLDSLRVREGSRSENEIQEASHS